MKTGGSRGHDVGGSDPGFGRAKPVGLPPKTRPVAARRLGVAPAHVVKIVRANARLQE